MKLNLLYKNPAGVLDGYLNLDHFGIFNSKAVQCDLSNLDKFIDNSECELILAHHILDYMDKELASKCVLEWIKKTRIGGKIIISGVDANLLFKKYENGYINMIQLNDLLYSNDKKSILTLSQLVSQFRLVANIKVTAAYIEGINYFVEITKND